MFAWNIPLHPYFSYFMLFLLSVFWLTARALPRLETQQTSFFCQQTVCKYMKIFLSIPSELQPSFQGSAISNPWEIPAYYMYVCMHACMHVCRSVCVCICVCICVCVYACMCACVYECICMYAYMHVCMDGWMDVWMDGCMHACMQNSISRMKLICTCIYKFHKSENTI